MKELHIFTTETAKATRNSSARAFIHSLNILVKYVRLYGVEHKRTAAQFDTTWNELQQGLPRGTDGGFLLGVANNRLLLDGVALDSGQAESSFAHLFTTAGLASIHFSNDVTRDDFSRLVRAFALGGAKARDVAKQIKDTFKDNKRASIKINEVKFIASDPSTGEVSIAAQLTAQTLGPEFKHWLNDPQKLLQLIAAAEGPMRRTLKAIVCREVTHIASKEALLNPETVELLAAAWSLFRKEKLFRPSDC